VCSAIEKLSESLYQSTNERQLNNQLSPFYQTIIQALLTNAYRHDYDRNSSNLTMASLAALTALI